MKDKKLKSSFLKPDKQMEETYQADGLCEEISSLSDIDKLKKLIESECRELGLLSPDVKVEFFDLIMPTLEDSEVVTIIADMLGEAQVNSKLDLSVLEHVNDRLRKNVDELLDIVGVMSKMPQEDLLKALETLFSSLDEMQPETLFLLKENLKVESCVEKLSEVVEQIISAVLGCKEKGEFSCDVKSSLTESEFNATKDVLQSCGAELQREKSQLKCVGNCMAQSELTALFVALRVFSMLK
nr:PREDICTED: uncharacterized protein LOC102366098 [Latimeria chalumnae]|eukprot:XP_014346020.1 PREDICTED: uncharacterized protein LOC102366098 [Latimeria chalumnae]